MGLPNVLKTIPLSLDISKDLTTENLKVLYYVNHPQEQTNWCWAAIASAVSTFFDNTSQWTQCKIVSQVTTEKCCETPDSIKCDVPKFGYAGLETTSNLKTAMVGRKDFTAVQNLINGGTPIGIQIQPKSGSIGHVIVIFGYATDGDLKQIYIADPWLAGFSVIDWEGFPKAVYPNMEWVSTMITQKSIFDDFSIIKGSD